MKTLPQALSERKSLLTELSLLNISPKDETYPEERKRKKEISACKKKLAFIKEMVLYLESQPTEEFIKAEAKKLKNRKSVIEAAFLRDRINDSFNRMTLKDQTKAKKTYYSEMGIPKITTHLKSLNYLLS